MRLRRQLASLPACQQLMIQGARVAKMNSRIPCATTSGRPSGLGRDAWPPAPVF